MTTITEKVRHQYEEYPYPARAVDSNIPSVQGDSLDQLNHFVFRGRNTFDGGLRVLVAGCGTGDSVLCIASELKAVGRGTVVGIDLSRASLEVARARVAHHGLEGLVTLREQSLLDLDGGEQYDFINCSGCLHHLESPEEGLRALKRVLAPDGVISIMVYGKYGRTAVYQMQEMLRILFSEGEFSQKEKIRYGKEIMLKLPRPPGLWWNFCDKMFHIEDDWEFLDMFLHNQDRCYDVQELKEWTDACGMRILNMMPESAYSFPAGFPVSVSDPWKRRHIAEIWKGDITKHQFYVTHGDNTTLGPVEPAPSTVFSVLKAGLDSPFVSALDGRRSLEEVRRLIAPDRSWEAFLAEFGPEIQNLVDDLVIVGRAEESMPTFALVSRAKKMADLVGRLKSMVNLRKEVMALMGKASGVPVEQLEDLKDTPKGSIEDPALQKTIEAKLKALDALADECRELSTQ